MSISPGLCSLKYPRQYLVRDLGHQLQFHVGGDGSSAGAVPGFPRFGQQPVEFRDRPRSMPSSVSVGPYLGWRDVDEPVGEQHIRNGLPLRAGSARGWSQWRCGTSSGNGGVAGPMPPVVDHLRGTNGVARRLGLARRSQHRTALGMLSWSASREHAVCLRIYHQAGP